MMNKQIQTEQKWVAYGDVNPLQWGGIWVMSDEVANGIAFKGCYSIVKFDVDSSQILDLYVDVNGDWIDKEGVMDFIGMTEETYDEIHFAIGCTDYYSYLNFGCNMPIVCSHEDEIIEELANFDIIIEE